MILSTAKEIAGPGRELNLGPLLQMNELSIRYTHTEILNLSPAILNFLASIAHCYCKHPHISVDCRKSQIFGIER